MSAFYNEIDPYAAQWLRNLIAAGHIAPGDVDERSIVDVQPSDLAGYSQAHFFAGIGGWSHALRLAGVADSERIWTGSCPCQPFSAAGKRKGTADARHLWPEFRRLIAECNPPVVFGEQVASADGREWLAGVRADLEALAYAVGAADLCAASVGAPHIRQRLWWVADSASAGRRSERADLDAADGDEAADDAGPQGRNVVRHGAGERALGPASGAGGMGDADRQGCGVEQERDGQPLGGGEPGQLGVDADGPRDSGFWSAFDILPCTDGKARRVEPGTFPLAHGVSNRVGRLRAYGNAIVSQVAAEFIRAWRDCRP